MSNRTQLTEVRFSAFLAFAGRARNREITVIRVTVHDGWYECLWYENEISLDFDGSPII